MQWIEYDLMQTVRYRLLVCLLALSWLLLGIVLAAHFLPPQIVKVPVSEDYACLIREQPSGTCLLLRHAEHHVQHPRYRG